MGYGLTTGMSMEVFHLNEKPENEATGSRITRYVHERDGPIN